VLEGILRLKVRVRVRVRVRVKVSTSSSAHQTLGDILLYSVKEICTTTRRQCTALFKRKLTIQYLQYVKSCAPKTDNL
jgi:hypothetical protein